MSTEAGTGFGVRIVTESATALATTVLPTSAEHWIFIMTAGTENGPAILFPDVDVPTLPVMPPPVITQPGRTTPREVHEIVTGVPWGTVIGPSEPFALMSTRGVDAKQCSFAAMTSPSGQIICAGVAGVVMTVEGVAAVVADVALLAAEASHDITALVVGPT